MASVCAGDVNENNLTGETAQVELSQIDDLNNNVENEKLESRFGFNDTFMPMTYTVNNSNVDDIFSGENATLLS